MRVVTANVNGVRAARRRGGLDWLRDSGAEVVLLQEVRASTAILAKELSDGGLGHYHVAHFASEQAGRSGVAVLTVEEPTGVRTGLEPGIDDSGRWIEVDLADLTVASVYVHSGEADTPRQKDKYTFLDAMEARLAELAEAASSGGRQAIIGGDLNVAHREVDIKNWKGNLAKAGFLPQERDYLDRWLADERAGHDPGPGVWVDLGRRFGGPGPGPYTWWSWRGKAFDNDAGWRIDHALATPGLAARATGVSIGRADSYAQRWSDHAPVVVGFS